MIRYKTAPELGEQSSTPPQPAELTPNVGQGSLRRDAEGQMTLDIQGGAGGAVDQSAKGAETAEGRPVAVADWSI